MEGKDFSFEVINELKLLGSLSIYNNENLNTFLENIDILFIRLKYKIDKNFLNKAKKLKYICTPTTGLNHIDLIECENLGIKVISLKNEFNFLSQIRATPEHTFGLALALLRNYKGCFLNKDNSNWDRDLYKGFELFGKSIGIIGFGRVGKTICKYFNAFDCSISFYDINSSIESEIASKELNIEAVINKSDIVFLCVSYEKENESFFDKQYIDLLKGKYFINTARGELVDEDYLLKKIQSNYFAGVAIDVIANESGENNILDELIESSHNKNILITPHIAGATYESMWKTEDFILQKLKELI